MEPSVLDVFILSMLDRGCETPYDLHRHGNLSLGAISPSLSRLLKEKLATRVEEVNATRRPRHRYALTRSGKQKARLGWKQILLRRGPQRYGLSAPTRRSGQSLQSTCPADSQNAGVRGQAAPGQSRAV